MFSGKRMSGDTDLVLSVDSDKELTCAYNHGLVVLATSACHSPASIRFSPAHPRTLVPPQNSGRLLESKTNSATSEQIPRRI